LNGLFIHDGFDGTDVYTSAAVDAGIDINNINIITHGNRVYRAASGAITASNTFG